MVQLSPRKGPSRMQRKLPGGTESTCIVASSVLRRGQPDSGESCIVLQRGPTCSLVAKFPKRSVVACSTWILCCRGRTLRTRPRTAVCEPLMPDVVSPKAHQNNRSYVSSADLPSDSLRKNFKWWAVTRRTSKNHKTVKIGGWALARDNTVLGTTWLYYTLPWLYLAPGDSTTLYHGSTRNWGEPERASH